jgi:hypothetical protein
LPNNAIEYFLVPAASTQGVIANIRLNRKGALMKPSLVSTAAILILASAHIGLSENTLVPSSEDVALSILRSYPASVVSGSRIDIIDKAGYIFSFYLNGSPEVVETIRDYLDKSSLAATCLCTKKALQEFKKGTPPVLFYAPIEQLKGAGDIEVVVLSESPSKARVFLKRNFVLAEAGGKALQAGVSVKKAKQQFIAGDKEKSHAILIEKPITVLSPPERAHWLVAYGDRKRELRVAYLHTKDAIPLFQYFYDLTEDDTVRNLLSSAILSEHCSSFSSTRTAYVIYVIGGAILVFFVARLLLMKHSKGSKQKQIAQQ